MHSHRFHQKLIAGGQLKINTLERFPEDFMFQLTKEEWESLTSQIAISKTGRGGRRTIPYVFTEHGVLMLSSILNSERAIQVNIQIMRIFTKVRQMLSDNGSGLGDSGGNRSTKVQFSTTVA